MTGWQRWAPDAAFGAIIAFLGVFETYVTDSWRLVDERGAAVLASLAIGAAVGCSRWAPAVGLALAWTVCGLQVMNDSTILLTELSVAAIAFGTARWGRLPTVWFSAVSIPVAALVAVVFVGRGGSVRVLELAGVTSFIQDAYQYGDTWQVGAALVGLGVLGVPWLAGLALRYADRARRSRVSQVTAEAERDQAEEIARLRDEQARLARDVHDVVGHSLAVILAQAESAQYLPDADTQKLKQTMENIATSARTSLDDVRQVLASTGGRADARVASTDLDRLVEGVRASGHRVVSTEYGTPQPLPPELEVVAFRVLQEMLTNALKHGDRDQPVRVERHWEGELRLEVQNALPPASTETRPVMVAPSPSTPSRPSTPPQTRPPTPPQPAGGQGVDGMRRRLESVGGRLDVRRRHDPPTFTATAWLPVRTVSR